MNYYGEPTVPPRRKRSLSAIRFENSQDDSHFGFGNRMKHNFSTDHIPTERFHPPSSYSFQHNLYSTPQPRSMAHRSLSTGSTHNQLPGFVNPYAVHSSSQSKVPVRPHNDYLKYGQGVNVQYNPYNSNFNPTLMARPNIEPFQSTAIQTSIANAIANRRTPTLYSSKEQLNILPNYADTHRSFLLGGKIPPERPPPPRLRSRLSAENLSFDQHRSGMLDSDYNIRVRDRRSVSPTRQFEQRPYGARRSTSPMPNLSGNISPTLMRSSSGSHINQSLYQTTMSLSPTGSPTFSNYNHTYRGSREPSPQITRSPSPLRHTPSSPLTNYSMSAHNYSQPLSRPGSVTSKYSRSAIVSGYTPNTAYDSSIASGLSHNKGNLSDQQQYLSPNLNSNPSTSHRNGQFGTENANSYDSSYAQASQMSSLQVPNPGAMTQGNQQVTRNQSGGVKENDPMFSNAFTDHCDQYKSVTSKILSKKNNRISGEFSDVDLNAEDFNQENSMMLDRNQVRKLSAMEDRFNRVSPEPQTNFDLMPIKPIDTVNVALNEPIQQNNRMEKPTNLIAELGESNLRRTSSSSGLAAQQRKASLPSAYIAAHANSIKLSSEWSRENVSNMAHEARLRQKNEPSSARTAVKNIGIWFTRQFVFLLIAGLNILIAYMFYYLIAMLPKD